MAERRLAAIMFTDIVGYTAVMAESEERALRVRGKHRELLGELARTYGGRIVDENGDELVLIFSSALDAANCALAAQSGLAEDPDLTLRIGIHSGDVVLEGGRIYGDGVNVASRIRPLAEPGGVAVSDQVYDSIKNQASIETVALGEQELKGVDRPVAAFAVAGAASAPRAATPVESPRQRRRWIWVAALIVVLVGATAGLATWIFQGSSGRSGQMNSIAVLPFDNRSARAEDEFFVAGIHDEILTQLSRIGSLKVISRTSVMGYRDTDKTSSTIGEELRVATLLEGGIQRAGDTVRINVQLIDAEADMHLWAETYDRELTAENLFAIQSEMAAAIAGALEANLTPEEVSRLSEVPTQNTRAYELYLSGKQYSSYFIERGSDRLLAIQQYQRAVEEDPEFALAFAALSIEHMHMYWHGFDRTEDRRRMALEAVERAFEIDPDLPEAHHAMARYYYHGFRDYAQALRELEIAERGMPSDSGLLATRSYIYKRTGEWSRALEDSELALESDPRNADYWGQHAIIHLLLRRYTEAEGFFARGLEIRPDGEAPKAWIASIPLFRDGDVSALKDFVANVPVSLPAVGLHGELWLPSLYDRDYEALGRFLEALPADEFAIQAAVYHRASMRGLAHQLAGQPELATARYQIARTQIESALQTSPEDYRLHVALGEALAGLGEREEAIRAAERALQLMPPSLDGNIGRYVQQQATVRVLVPAGAFDRALEVLDEYLSAPGGWWSIEGLLPDPRLDPIRDDSRFQALVEKHRRL